MGKLGLFNRGIVVEYSMLDMVKNLPFVSVLTPCYNEEGFIRECLDAMLGQTYPKERFEILVLDGMSTDKTREMIRGYSDNRVKLFNNNKKIFSSAINIGVKEAKGDLIMIIGSHAIYPKNYIEKCVEYLQKYDADDVGARLNPMPAKNTLIARAIAYSLGGHFGKGREDVLSDDHIWVDTVFGGCYKKEIFDKIGLFNENFAGSSDMDFNIRLKNAGGKILLIPSLVVYYFPKSNLRDFFSHNVKDGMWAILPFKFTKRFMRLRHYVPLIFFITLPVSIFIYIPVALFFACRIAYRVKDFRYFFVMPLIFFTRHFGYGLGSFIGLFHLLFK